MNFILTAKNLHLGLDDLDISLRPIGIDDFIPEENPKVRFITVERDKEFQIIAVNPFRNRVKGLVFEDNNKTKIEITVKFGLVNWIVVCLWYLPLFFILKHEKNQEIEAVVEITLTMTLFSMFCAVLLLLKLRWDSNRLKNWIEQNC